MRRDVLGGADLERDLPESVEQLREAFLAYEAALMEGDVEAMSAAFDAGADVVRFGICDRQRGAEELARWRAAQPPLPRGRTRFATVISTWGEDFGVVTTCFFYPGREHLVGRQSQTWVRSDGTWRVVSAHVSEIPA